MTNLSDFKDAFYRSYLTTHHVPRKGVVDMQQVKDRVPRWEKTIRRFLPSDRNAEILDIGCGFGAVVWWMQQAGYRNAAGIDISEEQISAAQELGIPNIHQGDLLPFLRERPGNYDLIIARDVFEHFERGVVLEILSVIKESLKPGGRLVFQVPNAESPFGNRIRYGDFTHELAFTPSSVSQLSRVLGFSEVKIYPVEPVVFGLKSFIRLILWKLMQWLFRAMITIEVGRGPWIVSQNLIAAIRR